jgi:hypothetical protein
MKLLDRLTGKKQPLVRHTRKEAVYVSKLGGKRSKSFNEEKEIVVKKSRWNFVGKIKGMYRKISQRYIKVIRSDINVICSWWKPRIVYKCDPLYELYEETPS